jgi:hypothetical protein
MDPMDDQFGNNILRNGEVKRIIYPEDPTSRTKKFVEYDVLVAHRANGTAVTKMYSNCLHINSLSSLADYSYQTLRVDKPKPGATADEDSSMIENRLGSKVLVLCINGASSEPVIIGGIRDDSQSDVGRKDRGVHMDWEFNGVHVSIADDGSYSVEYKGPTTTRGELDPDRGKDESTGTKVSVSANGTFKVATKSDKQSVVIDHSAGTITVTGDKDLTLKADKIHIGGGADEHAVLGDTLVDLMGNLIDLMVTEQHPTAVGPSGPPLNAPAYKALKLRLQTALSQFTFVKKVP